MSTCPTCGGLGIVHDRDGHPEWPEPTQSSNPIRPLAAEQAEPDRQFTWTVMDGHPYASDFGHKGPLYAYSVEPFDVTA